MSCESSAVFLSNCNPELAISSPAMPATMAILKALKISGGGKSTKVLAIGTTKTFKGVLTGGKPSINAGQFMSVILDELDRRTATMSTLLEDLQKLYKINWPPVGSDELVLFEEESVNRLAKRFGLSARSMEESFLKYKDGKPQSQFIV